MSMRPVDMQTILPRSAEAAKVNNNLAARPDEQQQVFSEHLQRQVEAEQRQVNQSGKTEKNKVDKDGGNKNKYKNMKQNKKDSGKDGKKKKNASTSMYDISI